MNRRYDLPNTGRTLYPLSNKNSWRARSLDDIQFPYLVMFGRTSSYVYCISVILITNVIRVNMQVTRCSALWQSNPVAARRFYQYVHLHTTVSATGICTKSDTFHIGISFGIWPGRLAASRPFLNP